MHVPIHLVSLLQLALSKQQANRVFLKDQESFNQWYEIQLIL
jgi:hypothetical protein